MENSLNSTNSSDLFESWTQLNDAYSAYDCVLTVLAVVGIASNVLIIYIQRKLGEGMVSGARSTNRLIICLAVADLLTAVFIIPIPELVNVPKTSAGEFYCRFIEAQPLAWICFMGSVYTLTTISIERYLAVVHPFAYKVWAHGQYHVGVTIVIIWLSAIAVNIFSIVHHTVDESGRCSSNYPSEGAQRVNGIFIFLIEYFGPLMIMCFASARSVYVLREDSFAGMHDSVDESQDPQSATGQFRILRRRVTVMFAVIVVTFMTLWAPDQLGYLLSNLGALGDDYTDTAAYKVFVKIAFLNAIFINPLVYSIWLPGFRRAFRDSVLCRGLEKSSRVETLTYSSTHNP